MNNNRIQIKALKAGNGDSFLISYIGNHGKRVNIMVDGGNGRQTFEDHIRKEIESRIKKKQIIDVFIITHIDQDHIKGLIYLTEDIKNPSSPILGSSIDKYWFNSAQKDKKVTTLIRNLDVSAREMAVFESYLHTLPDIQWDINNRLKMPMEIELYGAKITILSPNDELMAKFQTAYGNPDVGFQSTDYKKTINELKKLENRMYNEQKEDLDEKLQNATSIAFLLEYKEKSLLYLGDAIPEIIKVSLKQILMDRKVEKLKVDAVKLSHHGSRKSLSVTMLKMIDSRKFIISTNGKKAGLPNKSTIAKILLGTERKEGERITFHFNYENFSDCLNLTVDEKRADHFECLNANYQHGYCLTI
ncbi:ComEC/Rec2 family competence protein [Pedobacter sp. WC2423]|uniref:ComEC/Rec2 family competence protein n=1 Tax=Pedobacter sp. WC2423 TaxID=3234142 RepID=UPI00346651CF